MPETATEIPPVRRHRSLFLSDLHLGSIGARADLVLKFLEQNRAETYILVGDILDITLPFVTGRSASCDAVIGHLRQRHTEGARLVYLRGNHDPAPEKTSERRRLPVDPIDEIIHVAADGRRYLVIHGDKQDRVIYRNHLLTWIGTYAENATRLLFSRATSRRDPQAPRRTGWIDRMLSLANAFFRLGKGHQVRLVDLAAARGADGVICGHYHVAELHDRYGLIYANCGDWVTSFTCLAEDFGGCLRLIDGRTALYPVFETRPEGQAVHA